MKKEFTKDDLRTGMRVVLENNDVCIVMKGTIDSPLLVGEDHFYYISEFNDDLTYDCMYSIVKAFHAPRRKNDIFNFNKFGGLIWERDYGLSYDELVYGKEYNLVGLDDTSFICRFNGYYRYSSGTMATFTITDGRPLYDDVTQFAFNIDNPDIKWKIYNA